MLAARIPRGRGPARRNGDEGDADDGGIDGVAGLFGLSTQETAYQAEAAARLHLPFPLLSDAGLALARAIGLPTFEVEGTTLLKRLTLVVEDGRVAKVFHPVFPPDRSAADVVAWLVEEGR